MKESIARAGNFHIFKNVPIRPAVVVATDAHPGAVTLTAMQSVGADVAALGEIGETVPALVGG